MAYRITSKYYNKKFWYIAPPKTGSQAVREMIERLPEDQYVAHPSLSWHMFALEFLGTTKQEKLNTAFNENNDAFFTTVRNPWARAVSYYYYQKQKLEERIIAYNGLKEAEEFKTKYPGHLFNYEDTSTKKTIELLLENNYSSFERFIESLGQSKPNKFNLITNIERVDEYWHWEGHEKLRAFHYYSIQDFLNHYKPTVKTLIFTQENLEVLVEWFGIAFNVPSNQLQLKQINVQGIGDKYRDHYSSKMASIVEEYERYIINMVGYKY